MKAILLPNNIAGSVRFKIPSMSKFNLYLKLELELKLKLELKLQLELNLELRGVGDVAIVGRTQLIWSSSMMF